MSFNIIDLWHEMGWLAKGVAILLVFMNLLSIWVFIDRYIIFRSAKKESLQFITKVGGLLKQNKIDECIDLAKKFKNSHLAKVFSAASSILMYLAGSLLKAFRQPLQQSLISRSW